MARSSRRPRTWRTPVAVTLPDLPAPLTIGVISDTHVYTSGHRQVPQEVYDLFRRFRVGLVLHGGDINVQEVLDDLSMVAPVIAVRGNNDEVVLQERLPDEAYFRVGKFRFGLLHGHLGPSARVTARTALAGRVDVGVYGHSHIPASEEVDGTILFNPGSATERRAQPHFGIGIIRVTDQRVTPELILFDAGAHLVNVKP